MMWEEQAYANTFGPGFAIHSGGPSQPPATLCGVPAALKAVWTP